LPALFPKQTLTAVVVAAPLSAVVAAINLRNTVPFDFLLYYFIV
jgi:hypothetical protein